MYRPDCLHRFPREHAIDSKTVRPEKRCCQGVVNHAGCSILCSAFCPSQPVIVAAMPAATRSWHGTEIDCDRRQLCANVSGKMDDEACMDPR